MPNKLRSWHKHFAKLAWQSSIIAFTKFSMIIKIFNNHMITTALANSRFRAAIILMITCNFSWQHNFAKSTLDELFCALVRKMMLFVSFTYFLTAFRTFDTVAKSFKTNFLLFHCHTCLGEVYVTAILWKTSTLRRFLQKGSTRTRLFFLFLGRCKVLCQQTVNAF